MKENDNDEDSTNTFTNPFLKYKITHKMSSKKMPVMSLKTPIISLSEVKAEKQRLATLVDTSTGKARCIACNYEWTAEAPTGVEWLECPSCSLIKGVFVHINEREDPHWVCNCGNQLFKINTEGVYCPNCGCWQSGFLDTITRT